VKGLAVGTEDFFNSMADTWDEVNRYPMEKIEHMLDMPGIKQGDTVLDVGTGTGILLPLLMQRTGAHNITAIDAAEKMIDKAIGKFGSYKIQFISADVLEYGFPDNAFDHIICYSVFPHFEDKRAVIYKFAAILKPGGLLSVLHSSARAHINGMHSHIQSPRIKMDYLLPAAEYIPLLNRNGLKEEHVIDNDEMFILCGRKQVAKLTG
jgi:demethylmenaquinone methyltransferase/2-methoxy-6-polyprenyl-1,4-benzoquinol methylase